MPEASDVFDIERTGERFVFTRRPAATDGELLEIEFYVKQFAPPAHVHMKLEERVEVLSGRARIWTGGKERLAGPGETVAFPAGVGHTFKADGDEYLRFRCEVVPPMQMEPLFETIFGLYRDGKADKRGQPNLLQNALLARESDSYLAGPPIWLQKPLVAFGAWVAERLGYRVRYEKYSGPAQTG
jgi:mannose-6-phosphate isomerase-like protein (cupin superfamily)